MLRQPSAATLRKYGLDVRDWEAIRDRQGGVCAVCRTLPSSNRLHVEHLHVKGWKRMPPEQRKLYVRGLCCFMCNTQYLGRGITVAKAESVVSYLRAFDERLRAADQS